MKDRTISFLISLWKFRVLSSALRVLAQAFRRDLDGMFDPIDVAHETLQSGAPYGVHGIFEAILFFALLSLCCFILMYFYQIYPILVQSPEV